MPRSITLAAAQMGPVTRSESRAAVVRRMLDLMRQGAGMGAQVVAFPEACLTAFFPHWWSEDEAEIDSWFEREMPGPATMPLFDEARRLGIGFHLGYCELDTSGGRKRRFNSSILVASDGSIIGKYRKIHLPGHADHRPQTPFQNLEKRFFEVGDLGFGAWRAWGGVAGMLICNDRRWPEAWRVLALRGAELVVIGYNSASYDPNGGETETPASRTEHSQLAARANAYMNATWAITIAKAGNEDGSGLIGGSCITDPNGHIVAEAKTLGDEIIIADVDLDACQQGREKMFNFAQHRRPQWYGPITTQTGAEPPK